MAREHNKVAGIHSSKYLLCRGSCHGWADSFAGFLDTGCRLEVRRLLRFGGNSHRSVKRYVLRKCFMDTVAGADPFQGSVSEA